MSDRDQAYALIDQLAPEQLATALYLLKEIADDEDEDFTEPEYLAVEASVESYRQGNRGKTMEEFAAECGFTMEQVRNGQL